jgi:hypothetical protein
MQPDPWRANSARDPSLIAGIDACSAFGEVLTGSKQDGSALFEACEK